jgi:hypothetical protein
MSTHLPEPKENQYVIRDFIGYLIPIGGTIICYTIAVLTKHTYETAYDISRDLAIAFVVALIVTVIYEVYARSRYERKNFINTLQVIMNEIVHPGVWEEVRNQIIDRNMIRENCMIRLKLEKETGLRDGQMVLCVEFEYDLQSLSSKPERVTVLHYLDDHIECPTKKLPRFELIEVGKENFCDTALDAHISSGVFSFDTTLKPRGQSDTQVRSRRREITYVPGSYNLIMGEICCGLRLRLDEIPSGIKAFVHVWPHTDKPIPLIAGVTLDEFHDKILLPGQGCEFRFH